MGIRGTWKLKEKFANNEVVAEMQAKQSQAKRKKTVYPSAEIPHLWFHQVTDEARNSNRSFYFSGETIYSYGSHFPIATLVNHPKFGKFVLFTTGSYSVTTSGHMSAVRGGIPSGTVVLNVPIVEGSWGNTALSLSAHRENVTSYVKRVNTALDAASRARSEWRLRSSLGSARELIIECQNYCQRFKGVKCPKFPNVDEFENSDKLREHAAHLWEMARTQKERDAQRQAAAEIKRREQLEETIQKFRNGEDFGYGIHGIGGDLLRVKGEEAQTSRGVRVPLADAVKAMRFALAMHIAGKTWRRNGETVKVGGYQIDSIGPDGVIAGCHRFNWVEVERFRGLVEGIGR